MSDKAKATAEPSMDDILASIRKILNEDEPGDAAPAAAPAPAPEPLILTEEMLVSEPPAAEVEVSPPPGVQIVPPPAPVMAEPPPAPPPLEETPAVVLAAEPVAMQEPPMPETELVAPAAAAAAAASMGALLRAVSQERSSAVTRGGPTIEDVVREEVRPILKEWLDTHLPGIVERAVRAEIERVVGRSL